MIYVYYTTADQVRAGDLIRIDGLTLSRLPVEAVEQHGSEGITITVWGQPHRANRGVMFEITMDPEQKLEIQRNE